MNEADMAVFGFACTYERMEVAHCLPSVNYIPYNFFSRYPLETTKLWNLTKLLTPVSWVWTFAAIVSVVITMKVVTFVGIHLGCSTSMQEITLVPIR